MGAEIEVSVRSMIRASSPLSLTAARTQGFALGWDEAAPLALEWRLVVHRLHHPRGKRRVEA